MSKESIYEHLRREGVSRRDFMKMCSLLAGAMGLNAISPVEMSKTISQGSGGISLLTKQVAKVLQSKPRVPVIWLECQDCAGCTEALTRSTSPTLVNLVLNEITVEYHETLSAAAGFQVEQAKQDAMKKYAGQYILVVEGSIPTGNNSVYCTVGGRSAVDFVKEAAAGAAAIISTGNCSSFGGLPAAKPNPTEAKSVEEIITGKPVINIPGCPAIPEVFTGTVLYYLVFNSLPELDSLNRPKTFYGVTVHDRCLRRPFYEEGKFANSFDDTGAQQGWCLYKLGCKGPTTYNACASIRWDAGLSFPVQSGHPCLGCSQPNFWDGGGFYQGQSAPLDRPATTTVGIAAGAGLALGAVMAGANRAEKKGVDKEK